MTAEIAILNKSSVVLAADSAVTISAGSNQEKIFDTADKLFELSCRQPIGVMINNDMNFMEIPLPVLIKKYRSENNEFKRVQDAALSFLRYLQKEGAKAPQAVQLRHLQRQVVPIVELMRNRSQAALERLFASDDPTLGDRAFNDVIADLVAQEIERLKKHLENSQPAEFLGEVPFRLSDKEQDTVQDIVRNCLGSATDLQCKEIRDIIANNIDKVGLTPSTTGLVVAGFGSEELFPTLVSFEIYGTVAGGLKYVKTNHVDIDRDGERACVLPFAQKEMVERFLYGLDASIERDISGFCQKSVPDIADRIITSLDMSESDKVAIKDIAQVAERGFYDGLANRSFAAIRQQSQTEIEDMVEFMPKPEMARMAEALVNLTSIKRRVSRGMETVGGPIDVAVISQAEGFVWVKRKHYFPPDLNRRYFERMQPQVNHAKETE